MVEVIENLIVKVGSHIPINDDFEGDQNDSISKTISDWKAYTLMYFQNSPNVFLIENEFYQLLSPNMKVRIIKEILYKPFKNKLEIIFVDPEFGFKADDKLISQIIASLTCEYCDDRNVIPIDIVSPGIYFIYEGTIELYSKKLDNPILNLNEGSYFGEISYIFEIINQYYYYFK